MQPYNARINFNLTVDSPIILPPVSDPVSGPAQIPTLPSFQQVVIQCIPPQSIHLPYGDLQSLYPYPHHPLHLKIEIVVRLILAQPNQN